MVTADCIMTPEVIFILCSHTVSVLPKTGSLFYFDICIDLSHLFKLLQVQFYNGYFWA